MSLELRVNGPGGFLCTISSDAEVSFAELQRILEDRTGASLISQQLYHGTNELTDDGDLTEVRSLLDVEGGGVVEILLVRRTSEQISWLQKIEASSAYEAGVWFTCVAPLEMRRDRAAVLAIVSKCGGSSFRFASHELQADRVFVLKVVARRGQALCYASPELQADPDVVMAAVTASGSSLRFAAEVLRSNRDIVCRAVSKCPEALEHVCAELQSDRSVLAAHAVSKAVRKHKQQTCSQDTLRERCSARTFADLACWSILDGAIAAASFSRKVAISEIGSTDSQR